jgi:uncharacterized protein (DUF1697 family)
MRFVALLRGINVGTGRKLLMADVRTACARAGATEVETYIQSGNIVLTHAGPAATLASDLEARFSKIAGFTVPVVLRTATEWKKVVSGNPFDAEPDHLHVMFLPAKPPADALAKVDLATFEPECCELIGRELYLHLPNGMGKSKLAVALSRAKPLAAATARNWRTVMKLAELA